MKRSRDSKSTSNKDTPDWTRITWQVSLFRVINIPCLFMCYEKRTTWCTLLQPCPWYRFDFMTSSWPRKLLFHTIFAGFELITVSTGFQQDPTTFKKQTNLCSWSSNSCWVSSRFSSSSPSRPFSTKPSSCHQTHLIRSRTYSTEKASMKSTEWTYVVQWSQKCS